MVASMAHIGRRAALARLSGITVAALAAGTLAGCDKLGQVMGKQEGFRGIDITGADYGKGFSLHDANGQLRTLADFRGKVVQLYFGFTQCPDVCPTALTRAAEVKACWARTATASRWCSSPWIRSVTRPSCCASTWRRSTRAFVALRPTPEELKQTAAEFKVYYKAVPTGSSYTMDHSAQSYLFDPQGRLRLVLRHEQTAQDYAHDVQMLLKQS